MFNLSETKKNSLIAVGARYLTTTLSFAFLYGWGIIKNLSCRFILTFPDFIFLPLAS
jgi:hypothetical protein